jgi:rubredoxin
MDDTRMRLHCPDCRAIAWSRDGFTMTSDVNGQLNRIRVAGAEPAAAEAPWTCGRCGYRAGPETDLARHLSQVQVAHIE